jgi:hypothetical protein
MPMITITPDTPMMIPSIVNMDRTLLDRMFFIASRKD